jgi:hypothetical protein
VAVSWLQDAPDGSDSRNWVADPPDESVVVVAAKGSITVARLGLAAPALGELRMKRERSAHRPLAANALTFANWRTRLTLGELAAAAVISGISSSSLFS